MSDRDYFAGCHNVPMFADDVSQATFRQVADVTNCRDAFVADGYLSPNSVTLADYVRTIDARRVVDQLELPAELLPRADGQLFV